MPSRILSFERGRAERQRRTSETYIADPASGAGEAGRAGELSRAKEPGGAADSSAPFAAIRRSPPQPTVRQLDHRRAMLLHLAGELAKCGLPYRTVN